MKLIAKKFLITLRNEKCVEGKTFLGLNAELRETKMLKKWWYVTHIAYTHNSLHYYFIFTEKNLAIKKGVQVLCTL